MPSESPIFEDVAHCGDQTTVDLHREAIRRRRPQLDRLYGALAEATESLAVR